MKTKDFTAYMIQRNNSLKRADREVFAHLGKNEQFGIASSWGQHVRGGARWSKEETDDLLMRANEMSTAGNRLLTHHDLAALAWIHGRSASAVDSQLYKVLGFKNFSKLVKI